MNIKKSATFSIHFLTNNSMFYLIITKVTFNPVNREHLLTNTTISSSEQSSQADSTNSNYTTSSSNRSEFFDKNLRIRPYVDFSDYYRNVEITRHALPSNIRFN